VVAQENMMKYVASSTLTLAETKFHRLIWWQL